MTVNPGSGNTASLVWGGGSNTTDISSQGSGLTLASGTTSFDLQGGTVTFAGPVAGPGNLSFSNGTLQIGNGGSSGTLGAGAVTDNGSLVFNRSDSYPVPNSINGTGSLTQAGSGTLTLSGTNTYTGGTSVTNGLLVINNSAAIPTGSTLSIGAAARSYWATPRPGR